MARYNTQNKIKVDRTGRKSFITKILPSIDVDDSDIFVYRTEGVGLSALAKQHYDDETLWWVIAKANGVGTRGFGIDKKLNVIRIPHRDRLPEIVSDAGATY
jgi:hypothetical protein